MPITTTMFSSLTDDMQSIFNEVAKTSVSEMVGSKIFSVKDTNRLTYDHLILHGLGMPSKIAEGQDIPMSTTEEGKFIALYKSLLINGENLKRKAMATLTKQAKKIAVQVQRLSKETAFIAEATVRSCVKA